MKSFLFYILPVVGILFLAVNFFVGEPKFASLQNEANHYALVEDYTKLENVYKQLIEEDVNNVLYHYKYVEVHFEREKEISHLLVPDEVRDDEALFQFYNTYLKSDSIQAIDIGHFGLGLYYNYLGFYDEAVTHFGEIKNRELPYLNFLYGNLYSYLDTAKAKQYYLNELENNGYIEGAYQNLGELYTNNIDALYALAKSSVGADHLSISLKRKAYFLKHDWINYIDSVVSRFFLRFNVFGFAGALLVLVVWWLYLIKIDLYQKENSASLLVTLLLGMLFAFLTSYLTDHIKYTFDFSLNGRLLNDLLYCIFGIGFIEELVKIIPFLIVLSVSKVIKEPIDYIIYASISALGFAFIENIFYFDYSSLSKIQGRALSATVSHMFNTSIIAYALVLGKFVNKYNIVLNFVIGFVIAAIFHGMYDFWLINHSVRYFSFLTFIQLLVGMFIWSSIINNCINNSLKFESASNYDPFVINDYLLYSLSFVFLFEYIVVAFEHGAKYANMTLVESIVTGSFLLIFLTFSLSKFDIIHNYWAPIQFWDWETFRNTHRLQPHYFNLKKILGKTIEINMLKTNNVFKENAPMKGKIISRELISWEKDWYLVQLERPVYIVWKKYEHAVIKTKHKNEDILSKPNQIVQLRMVSDIAHLSKKKKVKTDFYFVDFVTINEI